MTNEHLRPLLDNPSDMHLFFRVAELLARGDVPEGVALILRRGRMTALQKPAGGVRGIVAGDVVRRFVARTITQQLEKPWRGPQPISSTHSPQGQVASALLCKAPRSLPNSPIALLPLRPSADTESQTSLPTPAQTSRQLSGGAAQTSPRSRPNWPNRPLW